MSAPEFIDVSGRKTRVRVEGDPANPPVLLLHGVTRSLEDWAAQFAFLSPKYRVIALDLPGFGFSARRPQPATVASLADGVVETLDAVGELRPCHVVGNSLGGAVAMQLLAAHPDRVASLVLANSAGFGSEVTPLLRMLTVPGLGKYAVNHSTPAGARLMERRIFVDPTLASRQRIEHALAIAKEPGSGVFLLEVAGHLGTFRGVKPGWRRDLLANVSRHPRPMLILWGDRDRILPSHHIAAARRQFPAAQTHLFTGVGHMPQIERPAEFAQLVLDFLDKTPAPNGTGGND